VIALLTVAAQLWRGGQYPTGLDQSSEWAGVFLQLCEDAYFAVEDRERARRYYSFAERQADGLAVEASR